MYYHPLMDLSEIMKAMADPNRLRIMNLLDDRTLCVCDIEDILGINQSNLSRHLAKLKQSGLVNVQKRGQFMHYSRKPIPAPYGPAIESLLLAMSTDPQWSADREALKSRLSSAACAR